MLKSIKLNIKSVTFMNKMQDNKATKLQRLKTIKEKGKEKIIRNIDNLELMQKGKEEFVDFWHDFREFAFKGNIIELAVGIVIGTGFNNLVQSLVQNIIMPPIGKILGNSAFAELYIDLSGGAYQTLAAAESAGAPVIKYGRFLANFLDFIILALTMFLVIRYILKEKKNHEESKSLK